MKKIEKIQCRALKFIYNDFSSSYTTLRQKANRPLLYVERLRMIVTEVYKCVNDLNPDYLNTLFSLKTQVYNTRNIHVNLPNYRTVKYGKHCIKYEGAFLWNLLDNNVKQSMTLKMFKNSIKLWNGPTCNCSFCNICVMSNI